MIFNLKNEAITSINNTVTEFFPKYTSQLINWANQNAQGTRPKIVGQMSELFPEFMSETQDVTVENWENWYRAKFGNSIEEATDKIMAQVINLQQAIKLIDRDLVKAWVHDLVINKTYNGLYVQKAILASLAEMKNQSYRLATPDEESVGIDGYVGDTPYSVKSDTYKTMKRLSETINVKMIYYTKTKTGLKIEVED